ncbi:MAG: hypothetical protein WA885_02850 [Phormidesmis sp.]
MASRSNQGSGLKIDWATKSHLVLGWGLSALAVVLLLRWLLPMLAITVAIAIPVFGLGAVGYRMWLHWQQEQRQQARIDATFYQLLRQQQGRISVLEFAMHTQMNGADAQVYLNVQAQTFSAYCEPTPQGDIAYVFNLAGAQGIALRATPAEAAWAHANQVRTTPSLARSNLRANNLLVNQPPDRMKQRQLQDSKDLAQSASTLVPRQNHSQDGYITITPIDDQGNEIEVPTLKRPAPKKLESHRAVKLPGARQVTIDVRAVRE